MRSRGNCAGMVAESTAEKVALRARTGTGVNWVGAFLLYAKGATLQEIADEMGIGISKLKARYREEDWEGLVKMNREFQLQAPPPSVVATTAIELRDSAARIEQNREDGLKVLSGLRSHIQRILDQFEEGKINLPPADIKMLTEAAVKLNQGAMVALGDDPAPKFQPPDPAAGPKEEPDGGKKDKRPTMIFNIHLPKIAQGPRGLRPVTEAGVAHPAKPADPFSAKPAAVLAPVEVDSEVVDAGNGRSSVDFARLAANAKPPEPAPKPSGIPSFFKA